MWTRKGMRDSRDIATLPPNVLKIKVKITFNELWYFGCGQVLYEFIYTGIDYSHCIYTTMLNIRVFWSPTPSICHTCSIHRFSACYSSLPPPSPLSLPLLPEGPQLHGMEVPDTTHLHGCLSRKLQDTTVYDLRSSISRSVWW